MDYKPLRSTAPPTSILNPARRYVSAAHTNIRELFDRIRAEHEKAQNVATFKRKSAT